MRSTSSAFVVILILAHFVEGPESLAVPLSLFRDGPAALLGYLLFAMLAGTGYLLIRCLRHSNAVDDSHVYAAGLCLLVLVAVTPSQNIGHLGASFMLLGLLYLYHATLLWDARSRWFRIHLFVPILVLGLTGAHSYGLWQKGLILYGLAAMNLHAAYARRKAGGACQRAWRSSRAPGPRHASRTATMRVAHHEARGWGP
jgi:hypothetical protein